MLPDEPEGSPGETGSIPQGVTCWKPRAVAEARQLTENSAVAVADWISDTGNVCDQFPDHLRFASPQGYQHAEIGDWVIRGWHGVFWAISGDEFAETYEPAGSPGDQVTVSRADLRTVLDYARQFDVDDDPAMIRLYAAAEAGK